MGLEYTCVSSLYRSDFTRPKWEAEWTEKEIRDLCSVPIVAHNIYTPALSTPVNILRRLHIDIDDRTVRLAFLLFGFGFIGVGTVHSRVTQGDRHNCISLVDMVGSRIPGGGAPDIVSL